MSENTEKKIGTKRIMDVPIIEELGENSYVLVNNNGEAAQISGSKVGGGGGYSKLLWVIPDANFTNMSVCRENDISTILDFETGMEKLLSDMAFRADNNGDEMVIGLSQALIAREKKMLVEFVSSGDRFYVFSDTVVPED